MRFLILYQLLILTFSGGCYPESLNYRPGWGTQWIDGTLLEENGNDLKSKGFVVVLEYYSQFIQFENELTQAELAFNTQKILREKIIALLKLKQGLLLSSEPKISKVKK